MTEVFPNLFVGPQSDYRPAEMRDWFVLHACKEPFHREIVGYASKSLPRSHSEFHAARRDRRLALNLIDAPIASMIGKGTIDSGLAFMDEALEGNDTRLLVHCNQGRSRSPSIALLWLVSRAWLPATQSEAETRFRGLYPDFCPGSGMRSFVWLHWASYAAARL